MQTRDVALAQLNAAPSPGTRAMQTAHTPHANHAQQLPNGWEFPAQVATHQVATHPIAIHPFTQSALPQPVVGGGGAPAAAPATIARMRWGRVLLVLAGAGLIAFGAWTATADTRHAAANAADADTQTTVAGGGTDGDAAFDVAPPPTRTPAKAAPARTSAQTQPTRSRPARVAKRGAAQRPGHASKGRRRAVASGGFGVAAANAAQGGGASSRAARTGELPMTGLSTWIAGVVGVLLLLVGVCVHVNAVRIGMTAMLYRRGILLRPVDCTRLAQQHGLPQVRVFVSNVLHRLLEEPATMDAFVSARIAR